MTKETYFEELSYALRRRELLPRPVEEDGLLPVEWNGRILCRVTESGAVRYDPTWVDTSRAKAALAQVTEAAGTVMEYMTLLENAPPLKADGLADGYRVLAEFNGTVLAGTALFCQKTHGKSISVRDRHSVSISCNGCSA